MKNLTAKSEVVIVKPKQNHPEPLPNLVYIPANKDRIVTAKYGKFEGFGKNNHEALTSLLRTMYITVFEVTEKIIPKVKANRD